MKRVIVLTLLLFLLCASAANADLLGEALKFLDNGKSSSGELDTNTIIAGLKEALSVGAKNGVAKVSQVDGYFGNQLIRIPVPDNIRKIETVLRKVGFHKEVDAFVLSMNRAAENAAPQALSFFVDTVKEMTIPDAAHILHGNDTAATDYLKSKTYDRIFGAFRPVVSSAMNDVGVTRSFKEMMDKARTIPLLKRETVDLDHYVTSKAMDGLFITVGQEEKKIRKDPAARVTELLRTVFE